MAEESKALAKAQINVGERGLKIATFDDLQRWAATLHASDMAPKSLNTPAKIIVAVQTGLEAGLTPMQAVRSVVVINGLPSWKGETALALVRRAGVVVDVGTRGEGDKREGFMAFALEAGGPIREVTFSTLDAKKAQLWGKSGPWSTAPDDMLMWRAVGRATKRYFSHLLLGLYTEAEVIDMPPEERLAEVLPSGPDPLLAGVAKRMEPRVELLEPEDEQGRHWTDARRSDPEDADAAPAAEDDSETMFARLEWIDRIRELAGEGVDELRIKSSDLDGLRAYAEELEG